jgi:hypothetical protein
MRSGNNCSSDEVRLRDASFNPDLIANNDPRMNDCVKVDKEIEDSIYYSYRVGLENSQKQKGSTLGYLVGTILLAIPSFILAMYTIFGRIATHIMSPGEMSAVGTAVSIIFTLGFIAATVVLGLLYSEEKKSFDPEAQKAAYLSKYLADNGKIPEVRYATISRK